MAATVLIREYNGAAPGTPTDKTSGTVRFKNADDASVDLANPLVVPAAGQEYSYEKFLRLSASGDYTQISNLVLYTDGAPGFIAGSPTEVDVFYAVTGSYRAPAIPDEGSDPPQSDLVGSPVENMSNLFAAVSGSPIDMDGINTGPFTPTSPTADQQEIGDFVALVMQVKPGATAGITNAETITFGYDEI